MEKATFFSLEWNRDGVMHSESGVVVTMMNW